MNAHLYYRQIQKRTTSNLAMPTSVVSLQFYAGRLATVVFGHRAPHEADDIWQPPVNSEKAGVISRRALLISGYTPLTPRAHRRYSLWPLFTAHATAIKAGNCEIQTLRTYCILHINGRAFDIILITMIDV